MAAQPKLIYYIRANIMRLAPKWFLRIKARIALSKVANHPDKEYIMERIEYYNSHIDETKEIIRHANEYASQFRNKKREKLIQLLVMEKYFRNTGQNF
jgi:hypothetical protein